MPASRWEHLWEVFHRAAEAPEDGRDAVLAEACAGDGELRRELEALLKAHAEPSLLHDRKSRAGFGLANWSAGRLGERIGPYRLLRVLGEGGMGVVYAAEQEEPVRRTVALKLIQLGMDTREVVSRFESERQALALMSHPNIAQVLDAGSTAAGHPYFVMEIVDGQAITDFCDARGLAVGERLELFLPVSRAIEHAHQRGIIHRDLKPSNVLVTVVDGVPVPKVIDFGVAKAIAGPLAQRTLATRIGNLLGTPEYMSPEQALYAPDVDTRSDVYSLGVLLYELLAGRLPFDFDGLSYAEILERIRVEEPPSPSVAVRHGPATAEIARRRRTNAHDLARALAGELDWILLKTLAKDRARRYPSVAALAADLERHLAHQPVEAGPPGLAYRARKFARRHRAAVAAAGVLGALLVSYAVGTALQSAALARALTRAELERGKAEQVAAFLIDLLRRPDPQVAQGQEVSLRQVLAAGAEKARGFDRHPEIQATLLETIGEVDLNLGLHEEAKGLFEQALALRRGLAAAGSAEEARVLEFLAELAFAQGDHAGAEERGRQALDLRRRLFGEQDPSLASSLDLLGVVRREQGDLEGAAAMHQRGLELRTTALDPTDPAIGESHNFLGIVRRRERDYAGAEAAYRQALAIWRASRAETHPDVAMALNNLALLLHVRGEHVESKQLFEELLPLRRRVVGDGHPDVVITLANFARLLYDMEDFSAAERHYRDAIAMGRQAFGGRHPELASQLASLAEVLVAQGRAEEAAGPAEEALAMRRELHGDQDARVGNSHRTLAVVHAARGQSVPARAHFVRAAAIQRAALGDHQWTAHTLLDWGRHLLAEGDAAAAEPLLAEASQIWRKKLAPEDPLHAEAASALGESLATQGRHAEAEPLLVGAYRTLAAASPRGRETRRALDRVVKLYQDWGKSEEAERHRRLAQPPG